MESSIAEFLSRKLACELLPTLFFGLSVCLSVCLSACPWLYALYLWARTCASIGNSPDVICSCRPSGLLNLMVHPCGRGNSAISDA